ncbi:hypothetical protein EAMG_01712 [Escherichia coli M056]|uniref:hypothetical protein n=1 Tax=Escherichia coli TaxID=562 RepID=UPI000A187253|nr:hypothetical protein [Escherichia coli]OSK23643.1 hypothetical protein EAMG_01712 [Escherichia coli M056]
MQTENQQPYFFNPGMTAEELEDWLGQQKTHLAHFNCLVKEKAALEERLNEVSDEIKQMSAPVSGKLSFPWDPSPFLRNRQQGND